MLSKQITFTFYIGDKVYISIGGDMYFVNAFSQLRSMNMTKLEFIIRLHF